MADLTGTGNAGMLENLERLYREAGKEKLWLRIPLIPGYNDEERIGRSLRYLEKYECRKERFGYAV